MERGQASGIYRADKVQSWNMSMILGGLVPFSLNDYPGKVAAVVFTQGCNFRCPFCHNGSLLSSLPDPDFSLPETDFFAFLREKRNKLDGVVISGGEPTLHAGLPVFIRSIKTMGFKVKLDTNGSHPRMLETLIRDHLLDYIAMDIKAPIHRYDYLTSVITEKENIIESPAYNRRQRYFPSIPDNGGSILTF